MIHPIKYAVWKVRQLLELSPRLKSKLLYRERIGYKLNLRDPHTLTEKIHYTKLKVYWDNPLISACADKFLVRNYIAQKHCEELLTKLYGVYDNADEIAWNRLPNKFVIKTNHGCGFNILCADKKSFRIQEAKDKLTSWLKTDFGKWNGEEGIYDKIKRKIIIEEYIETQNNKPPVDYKFFCSFGKVKFILTCSDRGGDLQKSYYWPSWEVIPLTEGGHVSKPVPRPAELETMIHYAERLSTQFPLVRVDLYYERGKIYFGELTFSPGAGMYSFKPREYDYILGGLFPNKSGLKLRNQ